MIPKAPFERDLSEAEELAAFEQLKQRLASLWPAVFPQDDQPYTSVVVASVGETDAWASYLEERLLFLLIRLRNPQARLVYVTSQPVHPLVIEYYLQLLAGVPAGHARSRLALLSAHDTSPRPLAQKILERPRLLERIRMGIGDKTRAYLTVSQATPLERRLAVLLDIPMNALDPQLGFLGTPEGNRAVFEEAGLTPAEEDEPADRASVELRINPRGQWSISSTHDHERAQGACFGSSCLFPADDAYRGLLLAAEEEVGEVLASKGVTSRCSVEFAARRSPSGWRLRATRIRFGMGETTHPMLALRFLTGGKLESSSGAFHAPRGQAKFYRASDDVCSESYKGLLPEDLIEILTINRLGFNPRSETGALFHMIGAVSQFGRLGVVSIGDTRAEADRTFEGALRVLDDETRFGRH